ncbi:fungal transcriptional regulatory protein [Scheffersomyces coipomensis]|uniref:fungal transcriptional regulatory protein n=1 Tax=Scheffersomyces coipomensis TaxID=1788519 RepID=UPI00315E009F
MSEESPISCLSCRRKKIKCNKKKPCNQCLRRNLPCEFPATFRNIKINDQVSSPGVFTSSSSSQERLFPPQLNVPPVPSSSQLKNDNQITAIFPQMSNQERSQTLGNNEEIESSYLTLRNELEFLKNENIQLLQDNIKLNQQLSRFISTSSNDTPLQTSGLAATNLSGNPEAIPIAGETSEEGPKYYGPQSTPFMIEALKQSENPVIVDNINRTKAIISKEAQNPSSSKHSLYTSNPTPIPNSVESKRQKIITMNITDQEFTIENTSSSFDSKSMEWERQNDDTISQGSPKQHSNMVEKSLAKKLLPTLAYTLLKYDDPDLSSDSETFQDLQKLNFEIITDLVNLFFEFNYYYSSFISKQKVLDFLNSYNDIKDKEWENDDDLLVLYMILILIIQKLTPKDFIELDLLPLSSIHLFRKYQHYLSNNVLLHNFQKLRHNLINESLLTIQAYILCTEYHFLEQKYEECWSMMFHTCSIAYSIGLHVMGQFRGGNASQGNISLVGGSSSSSDSNEKGSKEESISDENNEGDDDLTRYKVWFALKNLTGQVCSILGRPNPISIHINYADSVLIKKSSPSLQALQIEKEKTHILLKTGLSECLRLSNLMLIESFMTKFSVEDLLKLDSTFDREIKLLEKAKKSIKVRKTTMEFDIVTGIQKDYDEENLLMDLIVIHINRSKLFEPFINKFESLTEYEMIVKHLVDSITKSLNFLITFIQKFLKLFGERRYNSQHERSRNKTYKSNQPPKSSDEDLNNLVKVGKIFRVYFPFLNSFVYQIVIVIFTFLHYKFKDFVNRKPSSVSNNKLLKKFQERLSTLLQFDETIEKMFTTKSKLWLEKISYILKRVLRYIEVIYKKQDERKREVLEEKKSRRKQKPNMSHEYTQSSQFDTGYQQNVEHPMAAPIPSNATNSIDLNNQLENPDLDYLYGFQFNGPFWLTNPENLPFYLSSPSDDDLQNAPSTSFKVGSASSTNATNTGTSSTIPTSSTIGEEENLRKSMSHSANITMQSIPVSQPNVQYNMSDLNSQQVGNYAQNWNPKQLPNYSQQTHQQQSQVSQEQQQMQLQQQLQHTDHSQQQQQQNPFIYGPSDFQISQQLQYSNNAGLGIPNDINQTSQQQQDGQPSQQNVQQDDSTAPSQQ